jgi:PAS domain S-box-containing protein
MERPVWLRYGAGVLFIGVALALRAACDKYLGEAHPFPFFLGATAVAAWYAGLGPALLALVLGYLAADWFFMLPRYAFSDWNSFSLFSLATYIITGLVMGVAVHAAQGATRRGAQKTAQLALERELFRTTLASIGDAVITTDVRGVVTFMNPVAEKVTGWTQQEACGHPLQQCFKIHNELTRQPVDNPVAKVLREGAIVGLANHTVLVSKPGKEIPIDDSAAPIRDGSGNLVGTILVFRDVTDQRAVQAALRESNARNVAIMESSLDAIIVIDHESKILEFNAAAERIFGLKRGQVIGQAMAEWIIPERFRARHYQGLAKYLATGEGPVLRRRIELPALRGNGQEFPVELAIVPIPGCQPPMFTGYLRDLTEVKQAEAALQKAQEDLLKANRKLENKVQERTSSLHQSLKTMETVLYTIAHDLRGPNRAMQGFAQLLAEEYGASLDETGKGYLGRISNAALKNDTLICDLLAYGRLAHADLPMSNVDLGQSVQKSIEDLQAQIGVRKATIELGKNWPWVWANESVLSQMITNLLTNALKFVAAGIAPRVRIWAESIENRDARAQPKMVRLHIEDNGIGIPADIQDRLFQPFQRGTDDPHYQGTGMGLAIVQKGAERLGGTVGFSSTAGKGSSFWMELLPAHPVQPGSAREPKDGDSR